MKAIKLTSVLAAVLALTLIGTGCQKRPTGITPIKDRTTQIRPGEMTEPGLIVPEGGPGTTGTEIGGGAQSTKFTTENSTQDRATLAVQTVHFDYDSSVIKSSEQAKVDAVASFLKGDTSAGLLIEGHCDERGTEGYNDALGERRASALREALIGLGVNAEHVITQSLGERKPVAPGQDESAYAQNRRGEFIVLRRK